MKQSMKLKLKHISIALPIILLVACSSTTTQSSTGFELKGKLTNSNGETAYLELMAPDGLKAIDTIILNDKGEFRVTPAI